MARAEAKDKYLADPPPPPLQCLATAAHDTLFDADDGRPPPLRTTLDPDEIDCNLRAAFYLIYAGDLREDADPP